MSDSAAEEFFKAFDESLRDGSFVKLTLGKYRGAGEAELKNVYVRPVELKGRAQLSFIYRFRTKDTTQNYTHDAGREELQRLLGVSFLSGTSSRSSATSNSNTVGNSSRASSPPRLPSSRSPSQRTTRGSDASSRRPTTSICARSA
ncbi:MAG TPA: hypothetical protein VF754_06750 [Pyrinomonadaceae bacterium]